MNGLRSTGNGHDGQFGASWNLAGLLVFISVMCLAFATWPPSGIRHPQDAVLGVTLALLAGLVALTAQRLHHPLVLHALLVVAWATSAVMAATRSLAPSQVLWGFPLVLAAAFAAYYLIPRAVIYHCVGMSVAYVVAADVLLPLNGWLFVVVVLVTMAASAAAIMQLRNSRDAAVRSLTEIATTDPLTGVLNRRGLEQQAGSLHAAALRGGQQTTVVVVDLDEFKQYNDVHGHAAGDRLLQDLVLHWRPCLREGDMLARLGGDEFALILPNAQDADADCVLARMREGSPGAWSAGHAPWPDGVDVWAALSKADVALYRVKRARKGFRLRRLA